MMNIKEKIFKFVLKRQPARKVNIPNWEKVRTIAILYSHEDIPHIINQLDKQGKEVVVFTVPGSNETCWLTDRPKKDVRDLITARHFDVLIDLTQEDSLTTLYMAMDIQADFKTGLHKRDGILDMTIDTPPQETPDYLFEQILRYIQMIGGR